MSARTGFVLVFLAGLDVSLPQELDSEEKAFVGQCIDKLLNAKSERVRRAAEDALVSVGLDAIDELSAKSGDAAWKALEKLCPRLGSQASVERLESLSKSAKDPGRKTRLSDLAAKLRSSAPGASIDPQLAARVNAILAPLRGATSFSSSDPAVDKLVELGREAVPVLLSQLRPGLRIGMTASAITYALTRLAEPADLPLLRESLLRGNAEPAAAVGKLLQGGTKEALTTLHEAVDRGTFGWEVARALAASPEPAATARVVAQWFKTHPNAVEHEVASAAELLGILGVLDAVEALAPWVGKARDQQTVFYVGRALTLLGDSKGIPLLIRIVGNEGFGEKPGMDWHRPRAARALNEISGKSLDVADGNIEGAVTAEQERKFAAAAKEYKTWWDTAKGRLVFDKSTRQWSVK